MVLIYGRREKDKLMQEIKGLAELNAKLTALKNVSPKACVKGGYKLVNMLKRTLLLRLDSSRVLVTSKRRKKVLK
jgi:hypothetical protein